MSRFFNFLKFAITILFFMLTSCEKDDSDNFSGDPCDVASPTEDIIWLKDAIENLHNDEYSYYFMARYRGASVFCYGSCNPAANFVSVVQNCNGDTLGYVNDLQEELTDAAVIWQHEDSKCNFDD